MVAEYLAFEASIEIAFNHLAQTEIIDYQSILKVHEILFSDFYPWEGKDRNQLVPHLAVFKGSQDNPRHTVFQRPDSIRMAVEYALHLANNKQRFRERPWDVMGLLAFVPLSSMVMVVLFCLCIWKLAFRVGFAIDWSQTSKNDYLKALSDEIGEPSKKHLDRYLEPFVVSITNRDAWPAIIGGIKGLDGLDKENISYESLDDPEVQNIYMTYRSE